MMNLTDLTLQTKQCSKCSVIKLLEEFPLTYRKEGQRRSDCKRCALDRGKSWRVANKEHVNALARVLNSTEPYKALARERQRRYRKRHPEKKRAESALYRARRRARQQGI
jgi:hypothetical protein